jgi:hypothetical protein
MAVKNIVFAFVGGTWFRFRSLNGEERKVQWSWYSQLFKERERKRKEKVVSYGTFKKVIPTTCAVSMIDRCLEQWSTIKTNTIKQHAARTFCPKMHFFDFMVWPVTFQKRM